MREYRICVRGLYSFVRRKIDINYLSLEKKKEKENLEQFDLIYTRGQIDDYVLRSKAFVERGTEVVVFVVEAMTGAKCLGKRS